MKHTVFGKCGLNRLAGRWPVRPSRPMRWAWSAVLASLFWAPAQGDEPQRPASPPRGPFGYTLLETSPDESLKIGDFVPNQGCALCHPRQWEELQGSMHSAAHTDPLYRGLAEMAREEAGDEVYTFCAGCHSVPGVASGQIPGTPEEELSRTAKAGISCDVCHQISQLTGDDGPWEEPGNASFVVEHKSNADGAVRFGANGQVETNRVHTGEQRDFFAKSEFCASCHTVIHPVSGLRIEHTYGEWKSSVYAEKGIQCQDCHMRSVKDAVKVAETLQPVQVRGQAVRLGSQREIFSHYFVGGNANADRLAGGRMHARMAEQRLQSAARLEMIAPDVAKPGEEISLEIRVHNVAAGHNLPTGVTELRQMWIGLRVLDSAKKIRYRRDGLDQAGEIEPGVIRFGAIAGNDAGEETFKLWETTRFLWKRTIPPRSSSSDKATIPLPSDLRGTATIEARLFYRSIAPHLAGRIVSEGSFEPKIVEMSATTAAISIQ